MRLSATAVPQNLNYQAVYRLYSIEQSKLNGIKSHYVGAREAEVDTPQDQENYLIQEIQCCSMVDTLIALAPKNNIDIRAQASLMERGGFGYDLIGKVLMHEGNHFDAVSYLTRAANLWNDLVALYDTGKLTQLPANQRWIWMDNYANSMEKSAKCALEIGESASALQRFQYCIEGFECVLAGADPKHLNQFKRLEILESVGYGSSFVAKLLREGGHFDLALPWLEKSIKILQDLRASKFAYPNLEKLNETLSLQLGFAADIYVSQNRLNTAMRFYFHGTAIAYELANNCKDSHRRSDYVRNATYLRERIYHLGSRYNMDLTSYPSPFIMPNLRTRLRGPLSKHSMHSKDLSNGQSKNSNETITR